MTGGQNQQEPPDHPHTGPEAGRPALTARQMLTLGEGLARAARSARGMCAPIDVQGWCRDAGVTLRWVRTLEEGLYLRAGAQSVVQIRPGGNQGRRNFTVAHELGHHFIEEARREPALRRRLSAIALHWLSRVPVGGPEEERICNTFAAAMLLPEGAVEEFVQTGHYSLPSLRAFADRYLVTPSMAVIRISQLGDTALCFVRCSPLGRRWRVEYQAGGRGVARRGTLLDLPNGALRPGPATARRRGRVTGRLTALDIERRPDGALVALLLEPPAPTGTPPGVGELTAR